ncbi:MAG: FAD-linked oxidase C-terminal domain-containing protein, partial [Paracoccaceae bacterium]
LCVGFKAVLADGTKVTVGGSPRMAVGPDLRHILIGSEGCLGVITEVTLRLFRIAECRKFQTVTFPDVTSGVTAMRQIMVSGLSPFLLRFYDLAEARHAMKDATFSSPVMFLGSEGSKNFSNSEMSELLEVCNKNSGVDIGSDGADSWMKRRFDFSTIENVLKTPGGVAE